MVVTAHGIKSRTQWPSHDWLRRSNRIGIAAAALVGILANCIVSSSKLRLDLTSEHRYTLSSRTRDTLRGLSEPLSLYLLISRSDPLASVIKPWLNAYSAASNQVLLRWIDPDHEPEKYRELQSTFGSAGGDSESGKSLSDAVVVLQRGRRKEYVTIEDLLWVDPETGDAAPRIEQAITDGVGRVLEGVRPLICLTYGHRELSIEDQSPAGLSELGTILQQGSMDFRTLDLESSDKRLAECKLLIIADPELRFLPWQRAQLADYRDHTGSLWIMTGTVPDESGRVTGTGLNSLLPQLGIGLSDNIVVEQDPRYRLPDGFGESFLARVEEHAITHSMGKGDERESFGVFVSLAPTIELSDEATRVEVLLRSSKRSRVIRNLHDYLSGSTPDAASQPSQESVLAIAAELGNSSSGFKRRLIVSPASLASNRALRLRASEGNRAFVEGALGWLLARSLGTGSVAPDKVAPRLLLTGPELKQINRYAVVVMPGAALMLALAFAVTRGHQTPRRRP